MSRWRIVPPPRDVNLIGATWREWWLPTPRGWALLALGGVCLVRGLSYLDPLAPLVAVAAYEDALPAAAEDPIRLVCAALWCAAGVFCVAELLQRRWRRSMTTAIALHVLWASGSLAAWWLADEPRAYVAAARDAGTAVLVVAVSQMLDPWRRTKRPPR